MGERMNDTEAAVVPAAQRRRVTPFTVFGIVAALGAAGAIWEMSYYAGTASISPDALGTTLGVVVATVIFFVLGARAEPNS